MSDTIDNDNIDSVLFVCMGNICRSPTAEAVFRHKMKAMGLSLNVDSAGTIGSHRGDAPDPRAQKAGEARGYDFSAIRARKVSNDDFEQFSLILAMDDDNYRYLMKLAPSEHHHKIKLLLAYSTQQNEREVPDPYYGGSRGFDLVLDLIEDASDGILNQLLAQT